MRLRFDEDCTTARLRGRCSVDLLAALNRALSFYEPGYHFKVAYKMGRWDGKRYLFDPKTASFPAGLAERVLNVLEAHGVDADVDDGRPLPPWGETAPELPTLRGIELFADQREALEVFLADPRGCLCLPTGSGKTEIAAALIKAAAPGRALWITDQRGLLTQTARRLEDRLGERVGLLGSGFKDTRRRITVATIQTLWHHFEKMKRDFFPSIAVVVVDECHGISPNMWFQTLKEIPAPVRLGLSATIKEASRRLIVESYLGPIVHEGSIDDLVESGRAAKPYVAMLRVGGIADDLNLDVAYQQGIMYNAHRNELVARAIEHCIARQWPTLALCIRIDHGKLLEAALMKHGYEVPFLYGQTPVDVIDRAKRDLERGRLPAMIASTIFDKGQDVPAIRGLVVAGGMRSPLRTIQRVGRGMRRKEGDNRVDVLDLFDMSSRILQRQADERRRTYKRKYGDVRLIGSLDEWLP